ncbi:MAG: hypothetical protein AAGJ18_12300, partial [Bacteroidota bacterium]
FFLITTACRRRVLTEEEASAMENRNNTGVMLNAETMRLGNFFGNVSSNEILINVQGGPFTELKTNDLKDLLTETDKDNNFFIFNLHQTQTLEPEEFTTNITFDEAKVNNQRSVDLLKAVIEYFKAQDRKVYVLGTGFGVYLVQELLVREGPNLADHYLLMGGRLDMPEIVWQSFSEGNTGGFINGTTPFTGAPSTLTTTEENLNRLLAGLAFKRYTVELAKYNDLTNVTYCYGLGDEQFGRLTQNERALLITRRANLLESDGGHEEAIQTLLDEGFEVAFGE